MLKLYKFIKNKYSKINIKSKIVLLYLFVILIPITSLMAVYYKKSSIIIEKEVTNSILKSLKQVDMNLSYRLKNIGDISDSIILNKSLQKNLMLNESGKDIAKELDELKEISYVIDNVQNNEDIFQIRLYVNDDKIYANELVHFFPISTIKGTEWYQKILEKSNKVYWKSTYNESYINSSDRYVVSCIRVIRSINDYDNIVGVLVIDVTEQMLSDIISKVSADNVEYIDIIDNAGKVISSSDKAKIGKVILNEKLTEEVAGSNEGIIPYSENGQKEYIIYKSISATGWKIVESIKTAKIMNESSISNNKLSITSIFITIIIFTLAVFLIIGFIAENFTKNIKAMVSFMEKEGVDNFQDMISSDSGDIVKLRGGITKMITSVKKLTEESYKSKVNERDAQLKALQAQINPHFLYNTLETINWMAIKRNADDISFMLDSLAKYFRLSLNKGKDIVSITDELNLAEVYLQIQKTRFNNSFDYVINSEDQVNSCSIPKLVIQPIIENAILHGIQKKRGVVGMIEVTAIKNGREIILTVKDNGIGMAQEAIEQLLMNSADNLNRKSYGLYNVNERIKLLFGPEYGLTINSEVGVGTEVTVRIREM